MKSPFARLTLLALLSLPALASAADTSSVLRFAAAQLQTAARSGFPREHALLEGLAELFNTSIDIAHRGRGRV